MTEQERNVKPVAAPAQSTLTRPFVRLELRFRDGTTYSRRWPVGDDGAPSWRGAYASSTPLAWATMNDPRPMHDAGAIVPSDLGRALVAAHGDVVEVDAMEAPN